MSETGSGSRPENARKGWLGSLAARGAVTAFAAAGLIAGSAGIAAAATTPSSPAQTAATSQACTGSGYWTGYWSYDEQANDTWMWVWTWVWASCLDGWTVS